MFLGISRVMELLLIKRSCNQNNALALLNMLTAPYTPQHNGFVERRNKTLPNMTRSMIKLKNTVNTLCGEAVKTASYFLNRCPTKNLEKISEEV